MKFSIVTVCAVLAAGPAGAQVHEHHTAAHDSAHAIVLDDAQHLALHALLLGEWSGMTGAHHDSLSVRFENDTQHQQLMVRQHDTVSGFQIRGDTLSWKLVLDGSPCVASTPVSALLEQTKAAPTDDRLIKGIVTCGAERSPFTLRKTGS